MASFNSELGKTMYQTAILSTATSAWLQRLGLVTGDGDDIDRETQGDNPSSIKLE
jgi:hypothetical protein